LDGKDTYFL